MKTDINEIEILNPATSYEVAKVEVTDDGYKRVGDVVITLATGNPKKPDLPRKQGIRIDSLISVLLLNISERTKTPVPTEEDVKAVKDFIINRMTQKQ